MQILLCDSCHPEEVAANCHSFGVGIEAQSFFDPSYLESKPQAIEQHRNLLSGIVPQSMHGAFGDLIPASFDPLVRSIAELRLHASYETARRLGVQHIVYHHGYVPGHSMPEPWLKRSIQFWSAFLEGHSGVKIHVENVLERDESLLANLVDEIGSPELDICLDVGHCHCHSRMTPPQWIRALGERIAYVHLHNNDGAGDQHRAIFDGTLPMRETLDALLEFAPNAIWALETSPADGVRSMHWLEEQGYRK